MRRLRRASLWTLTRKSSGSRETEITAFAVMPSMLSSRPVVTTVTPVGKRLIAARKASGSASRVFQPCFLRSCSLSADNYASFSGVMRTRASCTLLRAGCFHKAFSHSQLLGPPAPDRLPVGPVPAAPEPAVEAAVVDVVEDARLCPGEQ